MKYKNHEESNLQYNFSHFRSHMRKFYHQIFFIILILILRALDSFCFRHGVLLLLLITPSQNKGKPTFPRFQENISQEPLKLFYQKIVLYKKIMDHETNATARKIKETIHSLSNNNHINQYHTDFHKSGFLH